MLYWALFFLVMALFSAVPGFGGSQSLVMQGVFVAFLMLFFITFFRALTRTCNERNEGRQEKV